MRQRLQSAALRWRRVYWESGLLGLLIRSATRFVRNAGEGLQGLADRLVCSTPQRWLTPPGVADQLAALKALQNRHAGGRIFILGTGSSLSGCDLSMLDGEITIIVNLGFLHAQEIRLRPTYLAIVDEKFTEQAASPILDDLGKFGRRNDVEVLSTRTIAARFERAGGPAWHATHLIMSTRPFDACGRELPLDFSQALPAFESVIHFAIAASLYMGAGEIVLLGCDVDYFINPYAIYGHSYSNSPYTPDNLSNSQLFERDQVELIQLGHAEFASFRTLRRMAERRGVRIFNASGGGILEVFERRALDQIIQAGRGEPIVPSAAGRGPETAYGQTPAGRVTG